MRRYTMRGVIKTLNQEKLYGFIAGDIGPQYFFHRSDLIDVEWEDLLSEYLSGKPVQVEFAPSKTPKGARARNVSRVES